MPVPTSYTENTLAQYLDAILGAVADVMGWTVAGGNYTEIVNDTLLVYGQTDISLITGAPAIKKLRALARREAWRAVVNETAADYDFKADAGEYSRSQIHKMSLENLAKAESESVAYDPNWRIGLDRLDHKHDPYQYKPEDQRTL